MGGPAGDQRRRARCILLRLVNILIGSAAPLVSAAFSLFAALSLPLSSLSGADLIGSDGGSQYNYYLSVCGSVSSAATRVCTQISPRSSACQVQVAGGSQSFDIGNWAPNEPWPVGPQWAYIDPSNKDAGVMMTMQGSQQCWATGSETDYTATIMFTCAAKQGPLTVSAGPNSCAQKWILPTPLACRAPPVSDCAFDGYDFRCAAEQHSLCRCTCRLIIAARCSALGRAA